VQAKPNKIVAGLEAEGTNAFFQMLALACKRFAPVFDRPPLLRFFRSLLSVCVSLLPAFLLGVDAFTVATRREACARYWQGKRSLPKGQRATVVAAAAVPLLLHQLMTGLRMLRRLQPLLQSGSDRQSMSGNRGCVPRDGL
jgi:hypothetical protein